MNTQTGQSLIVTQVSNGYILVLVDGNSDTIDTSIATGNNVRGYGSSDLATAIEDIFFRNRPVDTVSTAASAASTPVTILV